LIARGFKPDSVHVTGNPAFDGLFSEENHCLAKDFIEEHDWQGLTPILWAGHAEPYFVPGSPYSIGREFPILVEQQLRAFVESHDDLALIIRYHPSDWFQYPRHKAHSRIYFSETPNESLHPLVLAAQIVVVQTSTVGLEAAVVGKKVISVEDSPAAMSGFSLANLGVSIPCYEHTRIGEVITRLLGSQQMHVRGEYSSDGEAAKRVVERIMTGLQDKVDAVE
jgi:UDP-N-acetylglucosamine 2-epimerase